MERHGPRTLSVVYIEDDPKLGRLVWKYLERNDVRVTLVEDPHDGVAAVFRERPDVVLLDVMLPGIDGFEVCRLIRAKLNTPIVMLTARDSEEDRVSGLEGGADDYVVKPFSTRELLARIRAQARRSGKWASPSTDLLCASGLTIDVQKRRVEFLGQELVLTTYEFELLVVFVAHVGKILTREQLVASVRGSAEEAFDRSIDVHVSNLRKKLGEDARRPRLLKTVRGVGYQFCQDDT